MTSEMENPQLSLANLTLLETKLNNNQETVKDLEDLNYFISSTNPNYLLNKMNESGIGSFEEFTILRKNTNNEKQSKVFEALGLIYGVIEFLRSTLK